MNSPIKLPGLKKPIVLDPAAVAAHSIVSPPPDTLALHAAAQARQNNELQRIARRRRVPRARRAKKLDREGFLNDLASQLSTQTEGFVIEISYPHHGGGGHRRHHESRVFGYAIDPVDPGSENWSNQIIMHVASVSKLVTAMAMTRRLHDLEISPGTAIGTYLPPFWIQGPNIGAVTFAQLMTHTSGIRSSATDYASMEAVVKAGLSLSNVGVYQYENMNFSLCRMLLTTLLMTTLTRRHGRKVYNFVNTWPPSDPARDLLSINSYFQYCTQTVLISGETDRLAHANGDALAYAYPKPPNNGWNSGDISEAAGAAGWHFSTTDILKFMGDFRRAGTILKPGQAQKMLDDSFGIDMTTNPGGGMIYGKNGYWYDGIRVEQATVFFLPHETELAVLVNSSLLRHPKNDTWLMGFIEAIYAAHLS